MAKVKLATRRLIVKASKDVLHQRDTSKQIKSECGSSLSQRSSTMSSHRTSVASHRTVNDSYSSKRNKLSRGTSLSQSVKLKSY